MSWLWKWPLALARDIALRVSIGALPRQSICEVDVRAGTSDPALSERRYQVVGRALEMLQTNDPRRFRRLLRDIRMIVVHPYMPTCYEAKIGAVILNAAFVDRQEYGDLTLAIIHEGTHARISAQGIGYVAERRARIERCCVSQEIAFASKVPDLHRFVPRLQKSLEKAWWSDTNIRKSRLSALEASGLPSWLVRLAAQILGQSREP
jgi:hypothetical protein